MERDEEECEERLHEKDSERTGSEFLAALRVEEFADPEAASALRRRDPRLSFGVRGTPPDTPSIAR